ncbi:hypothetical protein ACHAW6_001047 [Cyclotella cf. meneghiniana]
MNKSKKSPNIRTNNNTTSAAEQLKHVKRVSFQKAIECSDKNTATVGLHSTDNLSSNTKLKPAMKTPIEESRDCVDPSVNLSSCALNSLPPVSTSQDEEASSKPTVSNAPRRRVKSMPVGSSTSRDFFGMTGADSRCASVKSLAVLHEDCVIGEGIIGEGKHCDPVIEVKEKAAATTKQPSSKKGSNCKKKSICTCIIL